MRIFSLRLIVALIGVFSVGKSMASSTDDTAHINNLNTQSFKFLKSKPDSARKLAQNAIKLSEKINYLRGLGDGYTRLGILMKDAGQLDSAIILYNKSLGYRNKVGKRRDIGTCYMNIGNVYNKKGDLDSALYYHLEARRIFESIQDTSDLLLSFNNIGYVYQSQKNFSQAEEYFKYSLALSEAKQDSQGIARGISNLGSVYCDMKNYSDAKKFLQQGIVLTQQLEMIGDLAIACDNLAQVYQANENFDSALILYNRSATLDSILHRRLDIARALGNMGVLYLERRQYATAISYLQKSIRMSTSIGHREYTSTNYKNLAQAYGASGDFANAYEAQKKFQLYNDSVFNDNKAKSITEMQTKYETEKKEAQISLLSTQNKVQRLQKNIFMSGVIALIILAAWLFIFFRQKQQISKRNEQIQKQQIGELLSTQEIKSLNAMMDGQEKERKRIAADLHDRIGASLAAIKLHFSGFAKSIEVPEQSQNQFTKVTSMFDDVVKEVRQVSHDLASGVLMKFGVVSAIRDLSDTIQSSGKMKVGFYPHGMDERLDHRTEISIYRITQELISNILKHAQASEINIHLTRQDRVISLMVQDDGVGFDPGKASGGIGMRNMRSRVTQMNGTIFFDSSPGKACTVIVELPIHPKSAHTS
ncbi:MAG TPA: sensor histidine kinase [Chitinophagales bacterium]|nr:sensor histidine kinase [Chitinophagales bacterium]